MQKYSASKAQPEKNNKKKKEYLNLLKAGSPGQAGSPSRHGVVATALLGRCRGSQAAGLWR